MLRLSCDIRLIAVKMMVSIRVDRLVWRYNEEGRREVCGMDLRILYSLE